MLTELQFERRLCELGYEQVLRPARNDNGVDFVVWTRKGWVGVQVKTATNHIGGRVNKGRAFFSFSLRAQPRLRNGRWWRPDRDAAYYEAKGVHVLAIYAHESFYLVPIAVARGAREIRIGPLAWTREAWSEVLGDPVARPTTVDVLERMVTQPGQRALFLPESGQ